MTTKGEGPFRLGEWLVRPDSGEILKGDETIRLEPKVMELLVLFARHPGRVLSKNQILEELWQGTFVSQGVVFRHVSELRRVLGDDAKEPRFLRTIPKKGYCLLSAPEPVLRDVGGARPEAATARPRSVWRSVVVAFLFTCALLVGVFRLREGWNRRQPVEPRPSPSESPAFEDFMRGQLFEDRVDCESYLMAQRAYRDALRQDPHFASNYKGLVDTLVATGVLGCEPAPAVHASLADALEASREAIAPQDYQMVSAQLAFWYRWNLPEAVEAFRRARSLEAYYDADATYAAYLLNRNKITDGLRELRLCLSEEPTHVGVSWSLGAALYLVGRYDEAIEQLHTTLEMFPGFSPARHVLALSHWARGDIETALTLVESSPLLPQHTPDRFDAVPGFLYAASGQRARAREALRAWTERARDRWLPSTALALLHLGLDERDEAIEALSDAFEERDPWLLVLPMDPAFAPLRDDPRFRKLVARLP
ncbi:MAG TPA: winged helix-turn-helix domain-containing protein [Vicinamibacteria bacterium]|nr:winged helix-turn-helix domain-containing protein [Vicinamibacteria bacterium]